MMTCVIIVKKCLRKRHPRGPIGPIKGFHNSARGEGQDKLRRVSRSGRGASSGTPSSSCTRSVSGALCDTLISGLTCRASRCRRHRRSKVVVDYISNEQGPSVEGRDSETVGKSLHECV